jgi:hypothetical protein
MRVVLRVAAFVAILASVALAATSSRLGTQATAATSCQLAGAPLGALPPAVAAWCDTTNAPIDTAVRLPNGWRDDFASGAVHAALPSSYVVFDSPRSAAGRATTVTRSQQFLHNGHWMVDIAGTGAPAGVYEGSAADFFVGPNNGGGLMRPDSSFTFEGGHLVIEFDVSAGMTAYADRVWPEIVVTTAPAPTASETNGWYAAGLFGGHPAIGCAMPSDRLSECRIYDANKITAWLSAQSSGGAASTFGGTPNTEPQKSAWHVCASADPDAFCRDRFRIDLSRDTITVSVNGVVYMQHRGLPASAQLPSALLTSPVYVYFASWAYLVEPTVARVHWGHIAINPPPALMR